MTKKNETMVEDRSISAPRNQAQAYHDLARHAFEMVSAYDAQALRFACDGNEQIATEYRQLSQEFLARERRYSALADLEGKGS
jgi:hypothetical protein